MHNSGISHNYKYGLSSQMLIETRQRFRQIKLAGWVWYSTVGYRALTSKLCETVTLLIRILEALSSVRSLYTDCPDWGVVVVFLSTAR